MLAIMVLNVKLLLKFDATNSTEFDVVFVDPVSTNRLITAGTWPIRLLNVNEGSYFADLQIILHCGIPYKEKKNGLMWI